MKLGISTYSLAWSVGIPGYEVPKSPVDALDLLDAAHELGVYLVQYADNLPLHLLSDEELGELKNKAVSLDIEIEVGTRGTEPGLLRRYLKIAEILGSKIVRTLVTTPDINLGISDILEVLPEFKRQGVIIAVENHGLHTTKQFKHLFDEINSPYVGCCLDTVNSFQSMEGTEQVINNLLKYTVNLHLKDFDIQRVKHQMGLTILGTPAGEGMLNVQNLTERVREHAPNVNAIIELWTPFTNNVDETAAIEKEWLEKSVKNLMEIGLR